MSPKTLLITGGSGYLGSQIIRFAQHWAVHATYLHHPPTPSQEVTYHQCDFREPKQVEQLLKTIRPNVIIHTACSNQSQDNLHSILPAAHNLVRAAVTINARFIHISTDLVFDGAHGPYTEEATPSPLSEYGKAKAESEDIVLTHDPKALVVRPSLIYGIDPIDHQTRWLLHGIDEQQPVTLFTDEFRSPIWVNTLCLALLELANHSVTGILHLAGDQDINRWEFGLAMLTMLKRSTPPNVVPSTIQESGLVRPHNLTLDTSKAQSLLKTPLLSVAEVTQNFCQQESFLH
ncbi:MAG: SDR family oxidoreductase [Nitrospirae bacterium]|nr:SDR family oxidoreductase [Nitrospirota bacterium]MDA1302865.1 SDR family oxidoreductase [Nitrospirota bacterium]